jgi:L-amino acid N-acyltransferase YncA
MICPVQLNNAAAIARIYQRYITTTTISFETEPPAVDEIAVRSRKIVARHMWVYGKNI